MPPADYETLLVHTFFSEQTSRESSIIRDWLRARGMQYDEILFSVRVGDGTPPNPEHLPGIQAMTVRNSRKRIDILARRGTNYTIVEVKGRVTPGVLGQLQTYRHLFLEERQDVDDVELVAVGRSSDPDTLRVLNANGVDVLIYESSGDDGTPGASGR